METGLHCQIADPEAPIQASPLRWPFQTSSQAGRLPESLVVAISTTTPGTVRPLLHAMLTGQRAVGRREQQVDSGAGNDDGSGYRPTDVVTGPTGPDACATSGAHSTLDQERSNLFDSPLRTRCARRCHPSQHPRRCEGG